MSSVRGSWMRSWRWAQTEWRRRRKLKEYIVLLVVMQTFILVGLLSPSLVVRNSTIKFEEQKRIGQYIVIFTTSSAIPPSGELGGQTQGKDKHWEKLNFTNLDLKQISFANKTHDEIFDKEAIERSRHLKNDVYNSSNDDVYSHHPMDISDQVDLSTQDEPLEMETNLMKEDEDDPDVGRGFEEEYVTHRSDGNAILLIKENNSNFTSDVDITSDASEDYQATNTVMNMSASNRYKMNILNLKKNRESKNNQIQIQTYELQQLNTIENFIPTNTTDFHDPDKNQSYKFKNYNVSNSQKYILEADEQVYFKNVGGNRTCFIKGTDFEKTKRTKGEQCSCIPYYYGTDCGIPEAVWFAMISRRFSERRLNRRSEPRRVINGLPVNHEFAMFEARMHELHDVVDVFVVIESNYTSHGDPKELQFLKRFQEGYLADFQKKIIYVKLGFFSSQSKASGWVADSYIRYYLGIKGLFQIKGLKDDDLFVLSDADELPTRELITFLKLYDGYPEPVGFGLRWNVFSFHWQMPADDTFMNMFNGIKEKLSVVYSAATIGLLRRVLMKNVFYIRKENAYNHPKLADALKEYRGEGHLVFDWVVGTIGHYAGWHCSWCFSPVNIVKKMDAAQASDTPRWGNYPEKKNLTYITSRLLKGRWFDDSLQMQAVTTPLQERFYAPSYLMEHPEEYRSLLFHPSHPRNINQQWKPP